MKGLLLAISLLLFGCENPPAEKPVEAWKSVRPTVDKFECQRCHLAMTDVRPMALDQSCTGCHLGIQNGVFDEFWPESTLDEWKKNIRHLTVIPSLNNVEKRIRRDWFVEFVQNPHDLRPRLEETMPRLNIGKEDAERLADELGLTNQNPDDTEFEEVGDIERGRALFGQLACLSCHDFGALKGEADTMTSGNGPKLAPDLRYARERLHRDSLVAWLDDPRSVKSDTLMPDLLTKAEAVDVAAFLMRTPVAPQKEVPPAVFLPPLKRQVGFEEVNSKVFARICLHCHGDTETTFADGDGGPGNTGGFGFAGKGVDFSTEELARTAAPRLARHLKARHSETRGVIEPDVRGMPLGLPPLSLSDIQLIETWANQAF
jgi:mono/diheme cytochrome c family protein